MRRLILAFTVVFAVGGTCMSGGADTEEETEEEVEDKDPVVVPVTGDEDNKEGYWCCEYKGEDDVTQYALVTGPTQCATDYGPKGGEYVEGNQCIPCCCKTQKDPDNKKKGFAFELTTPKSCNNAEGECLAADADQCSDEDDETKPSKPPAKKPPTRNPPSQPSRGRGTRPPANRR